MLHPNQNPGFQDENIELKDTVVKKRTKREKLLRNNLKNNCNMGQNRTLRQLITEWGKLNYEMKDIGLLINAVNSKNRYRQYYGVFGLASLMEIDKTRVINHIFDSRIIPKLISYMQIDSEPLQLIAVWLLGNILSDNTPQTASLIHEERFSYFIELTKSLRTPIVKQAIYCIRNLSVGSARYRDKLLKLGSMVPLLNVVAANKTKKVMEAAAQALSNLSKGMPLPDIALVKSATPALSIIMLKTEDTEVLGEIAWALSYLSKESPQARQVLDLGIIPTLIKYLDHPNIRSLRNLRLLFSCMRIIGNIIAHLDNIEFLLQIPDFLPKMFKLVTHERKAIQKEACWILSNITVSSSRDMEYVMGVPEYVKILLQAARSEEPEVEKEAVWALANSLKSSCEAQIERLFNNGVVDCFIRKFRSQDVKIRNLVLEVIARILLYGERLAEYEEKRINKFFVLLEEKGIREEIKLVDGYLRGEEVGEECYDVIEKYFNIHFR